MIKVFGLIFFIGFVFVIRDTMFANVSDAVFYGWFIGISIVLYLLIGAQTRYVNRTQTELTNVKQQLIQAEAMIDDRRIQDRFRR